MYKAGRVALEGLRREVRPSEGNANVSLLSRLIKYYSTKCVRDHAWKTSMKESTKAKAYWGPVEIQAIQGSGIDIGCGLDPVTPNARRFDIEHGDANIVSQYVKEQFDFVYSSHCLEHMQDPRKTILDWWKLVKPRGYLFVVVPDEDLYEQGVFPSRFNDDHKATFTISKACSWSPKSINVLDLAYSLPGGKLISLQLQDAGYDRSLMSFARTSPNLLSRIVARTQDSLIKIFGPDSLPGIRRFITTYYPVDQTSSKENAQAQIQLIVQKVA
jgi:SAM-dependent methyltransferase